MSKDLWMMEHERIGDDYPENIDRAEAERRLAALGLDPHKIQDELDALDEEDGI
tara:strand:+ start:6648 stop:6809 length:162 start_codon:yes stop_codon:yes gene_type:complete